MEFQLKSNLTEEKKGNRYIIITSLGRVYINLRVCDYKADGDKIMLGSQVIEHRSYFPEYGRRYKEIVYKIEGRNNIDIETIGSWLDISDSFMKRIIKAKLNCFYGEIPFLDNFTSTNKQDRDCLLKPVYHRYKMIKRSNPIALKKILEKIESKNPKSVEIKADGIVLYDVPCIVKDSKLRLLEGIELDLSEYVDIQEGNRYIPCDFQCVSLGKIEKFDRVEIVLENGNKNNNSNFTELLYGKKVKEVILIGNIRY